MSPTSAVVTLGENKFPAFPARMVYVNGFDFVLVAVVGAVNCDVGADAIVEVWAYIEVVPCAVAATVKAIKAPKNCISSCL